MNKKREVSNISASWSSAIFIWERQSISTNYHPLKHKEYTYTHILAQHKRKYSYATCSQNPSSAFSDLHDFHSLQCFFQKRFNAECGPCVASLGKNGKVHNICESIDI